MKKALYLIALGILINLVIMPESVQSDKFLREVILNASKTPIPIRHFNAQSASLVQTNEKTYYWNKGFVPKQRINPEQIDSVEEQAPKKILFDPYRSLPYYKKEESPIDKFSLTRKFLFKNDSSA